MGKIQKLIGDDNMEETTTRNEKLPKVYTYEIVEDGYYIDINGVRTIEQRGIYSKHFIQSGSYEDNAKAQIADMKAIDALPPPPEPIDLEAAYAKLRADIDFIAMAANVDLEVGAL